MTRFAALSTVGLISLLLFGTAQAEPPGDVQARETVLVYPIAYQGGELPPVLMERILVAIDATGEFEAVRVARSKKRTIASALQLKTRVFAEGDTLTCFLSVHDKRSNKVLLRTEIAGLKRDNLSSKLPPAVSAWLVVNRALLSPSKARAPPAAADLVIVHREPAKFVIARSLSTTLAGALSGWGTLSIAVGPDTPGYYHGEIIIDQFRVKTRRHHVRRYHDGLAIATFRITDPRGDKVIFNKELVVKASQRRHKGSRSEVARSLIKQLVRHWTAAFRSQVIEEVIRRRK